jgi:hypothetical protein
MMKSTFSKNILCFVAAFGGLAHAYLIDPPTTASSDTVQDCSNWVVVSSSDKCLTLADDNGITLAQFQTYVSMNSRETRVWSNPAIEPLRRNLLRACKRKFVLYRAELRYPTRTDLDQCSSYKFNEANSDQRHFNSNSNTKPLYQQL